MAPGPGLDSISEQEERRERGDERRGEERERSARPRSSPVGSVGAAAVRNRMGAQQSEAWWFGGDGTRRWRRSDDEGGRAILWG